MGLGVGVGVGLGVGCGVGGTRARQSLFSISRTLQSLLPHNGHDAVVCIQRED